MKIATPNITPLDKLRNWFEKRWPNHSRQTRFSFDGKIISAHGPLARRIVVRVDDINEIGIETTDTGPFVEDVFWLINRDTDALRIPQESMVFKRLMDCFDCFDDFNWEAFAKSMACTDRCYFLCWKRAP